MIYDWAVALAIMSVIQTVEREDGIQFHLLALFMEVIKIIYEILFLYCGR